MNIPDAPLLAVWWVMLWLPAIGIVWTPFAAVTTAIVAKNRGLVALPSGPSAGDYARAGALYSALLFFPWIYLIARILDRPLPVLIVIVAYTAIYLVGIASLVTSAVLAVAGASIVLQVASGAQVGLVVGAKGIAVMGSLGGLSAVLAGVGSYLLFKSSKAMLRKHAESRRLPPPPLPDTAYLQPIAWMMAVFAGVTALGSIFVAAFAV